jgi:hypothetical protein
VPSKVLATDNGHCWGLAYAFETTDSFKALKKQTIESSRKLLDLPGSEETMIRGTASHSTWLHKMCMIFPDLKSMHNAIENNEYGSTTLQNKM